MPPPTANLTRASRSRFSSPLPASATPNDSSRASSNNSGAGGQQTLLGWLEPPVNMRASYQDAGLLRHGVVENMVPLGTMPKVGIFKKAAAPPPQSQQDHPPTPVRIILKKRANPATPTTPAPAPAAATPVATAPEADETEEEELSETDGEDMDDEDELHGGASRRGSLMGHHGEDGWMSSSSHHMPGHRAISHSGFARFDPNGAGMSSHATLERITVDQKYVDEVVELAVNEAIDHYRYPTGYALRMLYDEKATEPGFVALIARIFQQTASPEDLERFAQLMHHKKREGKKDNTGCYYFVPPTTSSGFAPHEPKPAPYRNLLSLDVNKLHIEAARPAKPAEPTEPTEPAEAVQQEQQEQQEEQPAQPTPTPTPAQQEDQQQQAAAEQGEPPSDQQPPQQKHHHDDAEITTPSRSKKRKTRHSDSASKTAPSSANGKSKMDTPSKRRTRRDSQSSSSTLSSARSMSPPEDVFSVPTSRASPVVEEEPVETAPPPPKRRRSNAPRKNGNVSPPEAPPSPAASQTTFAAGLVEPEPVPFTMPEAINSPMFPNLNGKKGKGHPKIVFASNVGTLDENDELSRLRRRAKLATRSAAVGESCTREPVADSHIEVEAAPEPMPRSRITLPAGRSTPAPALTGRTTRSARKRSHDEVEEQPSPTAANFPAASEVASTAANSRAGTPAARAAKKARTSLRIKTSPIKKKGGTSAGLPRASGERSSPVPNGAAREDENDDYCTSCGGSGELVCCDGCTRSFHLICVDPPLLQDSMPNEWFCNVCRSENQDPAMLPVYKGAFRFLHEQADKKNSSAYSLPKHTRERFEGVRTGADGEYEDIVPPAPKPSRKKKINDDEAGLEFFRLRDPSDDKRAVLCHACEKSTAENRAIIPCSICGLYWHLDCLDPPLANPPVLRTWKCPAHIDDLLSLVPGALGPAHRYRKIKGAALIDPAFSRGNPNNGFVDIVYDDEEDTARDWSGWADVQNYGRIVKLSSSGIEKDFLSRARKNRKGKTIPPLGAVGESPAPEVEPASQLLPKHVLDQQLAAYSLAELRDQDDSALVALYNTALAHADPAVNALIAHETADSMSACLGQDDLRRTLSILEQLTSRLRSKITSPTPASPCTPMVGDAAALDAEAPPSLTNSQSTSAESENLAQEPIVSEVDMKKNLPSPAATDDVNAGTQLDEKPRGLGSPVMVTPGLKTEPPSSPSALPIDDDITSAPAETAKAIDDAAADEANAMDLD